MLKSFTVLAVIALVTLSSFGVEKEVKILASPVIVISLPLPMMQSAMASTSPATGMQEATATPRTAAPVQAAEPAHPAAPKASASKSKAPPQNPARLIIPSLSLDDAVVGVATTGEGAMAVPAGNTDDVGWYEYGTVPGQTGSAVIDAHVFAAFSNLHKLAVGDDIYIETTAGKTLRFVVSDIETYALADVPAQTLFARADAARLNLITCAGQLTPDHSTYDHRLVVYAVLAGN